VTEYGKSSSRQMPGKDSVKRELPKRFYKHVIVAEAEEGYAISLDGRAIRSPAKNLLVLPTSALAEAIAVEWDAETETIDPATMHLTRIANSAIDGVTGSEADLIDEIVKYASNDLLCYRAEHPDQLVKKQVEAWDPLLEWAAGTCGIHLRLGAGIMPITQSDASLTAFRRALPPAEALVLAPFHVLVTLSGSGILGLAVLRRHVDAATAWAAANVDEDWQISQWGEDVEATARREYRWQEFSAAAAFLTLLERAG